MGVCQVHSTLKRQWFTHAIFALKTRRIQRYTNQMERCPGSGNTLHYSGLFARIQPLLLVIVSSPGLLFLYTARNKFTFGKFGKPAHSLSKKIAPDFFIFQKLNLPYFLNLLTIYCKTETSMTNVYNRTREMSPETKSKISRALTNRPKSAEHRQHISNSMKNLWNTVQSEEGSESWDDVMEE